MGTGGHDRLVQRVDELGGFRGRTGGDLFDRRQPVFLAPGIDALRAVADEEIAVEAKSRLPLEDRDADLLGATGIDGRFVHHDPAFSQNLSDAGTRADERRYSPVDNLV